MVLRKKAEMEIEERYNFQERMQREAAAEKKKLE